MEKYLCPAVISDLTDDRKTFKLGPFLTVTFKAARPLTEFLHEPNKVQYWSLIDPLDQICLMAAFKSSHKNG